MEGTVISGAVSIGGNPIDYPVNFYGEPMLRCKHGILYIMMASFPEKEEDNDRMSCPEDELSNIHWYSERDLLLRIHRLQLSGVYCYTSQKALVCLRKHTPKK